MKASEIERDFQGKIGDMSKASSLNRLFSNRPIAWKIQPAEYVLWSVQKDILDTWRHVQGYLKPEQSGLETLQLKDKAAIIYPRAPRDQEIANMCGFQRKMRLIQSS